MVLRIALAGIAAHELGLLKTHCGRDSLDLRSGAGAVPSAVVVVALAVLLDHPKKALLQTNQTDSEDQQTRSHLHLLKSPQHCQTSQLNQQPAKPAVPVVDQERLQTSQLLPAVLVSAAAAAAAAQLHATWSRLLELWSGLARRFPELRWDASWRGCCGKEHQSESGPRGYAAHESGR